MIELRFRSPLASLEIMKGGAEIAEALTTCLRFSVANASTPPPTPALSHLISICKPVNLASPWRTFLGIFAFLLVCFVLFSIITQ